MLRSSVFALRQRRLHRLEHAILELGERGRAIGEADAQVVPLGLEDLDLDTEVVGAIGMMTEATDGAVDSGKLASGKSIGGVVKHPGVGAAEIVARTGLPAVERQAEAVGATPAVDIRYGRPAVSARHQAGENSLRIAIGRACSAVGDQPFALGDRMNGGDREPGREAVDAGDLALDVEAAFGPRSDAVALRCRLGDCLLDGLHPPVGLAVAAIGIAGGPGTFVADRGVSAILGKGIFESLLAHLPFTPVLDLSFRELQQGCEAGRSRWHLVRSRVGVCHLSIPDEDPRGRAVQIACWD